MAWKLHAIEQTQLQRQHRADGVGRPKFYFHTDARDRDVGVRLRGAHDEAANTAEAIDTDADRHFWCACVGGRGVIFQRQGVGVIFERRGVGGVSACF